MCINIYLLDNIAIHSNEKMKIIKCISFLVHKIYLLSFSLNFSEVKLTKVVQVLIKMKNKNNLINHA